VLSQKNILQSERFFDNHYKTAGCLLLATGYCYPIQVTCLQMSCFWYHRIDENLKAGQSLRKPDARSQKHAIRGLLKLINE
jgi:hypothetical protein